VAGQRHAPAALSPGKALATHWTGRWVGSRAVLDWWRECHPHRDSILGSSRS